MWAERNVRELATIPQHRRIFFPFYLFRLEFLPLLRLTNWMRRNHSANNSNFAFAVFFLSSDLLQYKHYLYFCKIRVKQQMEKWLIKRLLESRKKKKKSDSNTNKQTRQQNRLNFWQQNRLGKPGKRENENCEVKKKNNISSSTVVYFDLNTYGFSACFFHSPNE